MVTIHINGCTVTVPAEQVQKYRDALADKWIDGYRVYVENGEVKTQMRTDVDEMDWDTMVAILVEENCCLLLILGYPSPVTHQDRSASDSLDGRYIRNVDYKKGLIWEKLKNGNRIFFHLFPKHIPAGFPKAIPGD